MDNFIVRKARSHVDKGDNEHENSGNFKAPKLLGYLSLILRSIISLEGPLFRNREDI